MKNPYILAILVALGLVVTLVLPPYLEGLPFYVVLALLLGGFLTFFFAGASLMAVWLRSLEPSPTIVDASRWETRRLSGKEKYVREFVLKGILPCLLVVVLLGVWQGANWGFGVQLLIFLVFLFAISVLSLIGIARTLWDHSERRYAPFRSTNSAR